MEIVRKHGREAVLRGIDLGVTETGCTAASGGTPTIGSGHFAASLGSARTSLVFLRRRGIEECAILYVGGN